MGIEGDYAVILAIAQLARDRERERQQREKQRRRGRGFSR